MAIDLSGLDQFKVSSLFSGAGPKSVSPEEMNLDLIDYDPEQPRCRLDEDGLGQLAASIAEYGVLEPVSLRPHPVESGRFIVNRGERRCRASRMAGKRTIPYFIDTRLDRFAQVVENLQREDLSPFDLANFIAAREAEKISRAEIARRIQKPPSFVTEVASLISAPPEIRQLYESGRVRDVRALYTLVRAVRVAPAALATVISGSDPISREAIDRLLDPGASSDVDGPRPDPAPSSAGSPPRASPKQPPDTAGMTTSASNPQHCLRVEHNGRPARLAWSDPPDRYTAAIIFDDGTTAHAKLAELTLLEWTTRHEPPEH